MKQHTFERRKVQDQIMLTVYIALFPTIQALHQWLPAWAYLLVAGLLLGGFVKLTNALCDHCPLRWRHAGAASMAKSCTVTMMALALAIPALILAYAFWQVRRSGAGGVPFVIGYVVGGAVMSLRARAALSASQSREM